MSLKERILREMVIDPRAIEIFNKLPTELKTVQALDEIEAKNFRGVRLSTSNFFDQLEKLIKSSRSNYEHGRTYIGQKKLIESHRLIEEFLGDNLA